MKQAVINEVVADSTLNIYVSYKNDLEVFVCNSFFKLIIVDNRWFNKGSVL